MPKIVNHDERREELLDPCLSLFASKGFHAISMREIARHLGVTTGTLYHYFDGKLALFEQMVDRVIKSDVQAALVEVPADQSWPVKLLSLSKYLGAREGRFAQIIHVTLDYKRYEGASSQTLTDKVLNAYLDTIRSQLGITDAVQLDALFSLLLGVIVYRDLVPNASPIEPQFWALQKIGKDIDLSISG